MGSSAYSKSDDDNMLCSMVTTLEGSDTIQKDLGKLEKRAHAEFMKFGQAKYKALNMGQGNPKHKHKLDNDWIEQPYGEGLGDIGR